MIDPRLLDDLRGTTVATWERDVRREGSSAQWLPALVMVRASGVEVLILASGPEAVISTADLMIAAVGTFVTADVQGIAACLDSYIAVDAEAIEAYTRTGGTTLAALYEAGYPGVIEALIIHAVDRAGAQQMLRLPYIVTGRTVEWLDDPIPDLCGDVEFSGRLAHALRAVMTRGSN